MGKENITMLVLGKDYDKRTVIRVSEGGNLVTTTLNEKETLLAFDEILKEYGFTIIKK